MTIDPDSLSVEWHGPAYKTHCPQCGTAYLSPIFRVPNEDQVCVQCLRVEIDRLRGALSAQDERERAAGEKCGILWQEYGCDWPDWVADRLLHLRDEVERLRAFEHAGYNPEEAVYGQDYVDRLKAENEHLRDGNGNLHLQVKELSAENERLKADNNRMDWLQDYLGEFTMHRVHPPFERRTPRDADLREWIDLHMPETAKVDAARKIGEEG